MHIVTRHVCSLQFAHCCTTISCKILVLVIVLTHTFKSQCSSPSVSEAIVFTPVAPTGSVIVTSVKALWVTRRDGQGGGEAGAGNVRGKSGISSYSDVMNIVLLHVVGGPKEAGGRFEISWLWYEEKERQSLRSCGWEKGFLLLYLYINHLKLINNSFANQLA